MKLFGANLQKPILLIFENSKLLEAAFQFVNKVWQERKSEYDESEVKEQIRLGNQKESSSDL